jgi:hypothetical protein
LTREGWWYKIDEISPASSSFFCELLLLSFVTELTGGRGIEDSVAVVERISEWLRKKELLKDFGADNTEAKRFWCRSLCFYSYVGFFELKMKFG